MITTIIAIILMAHGLGHALGILAGMGIKLSKRHSLHPSVFNGFPGKSVSVFLGIVLSSAAIIFFMATGLSLLDLLLPQDLWQILGITASVISIFLLVFYWNFLPFLFPNKIGAIVIDLYLIMTILWWHWPNELFYP
jgi:hypothetical protein